MAFLRVSQQGEFKNTTKNFLEKIHVNVKNFWPKKLRFFFLGAKDPTDDPVVLHVLF
jgi:hypothetical protein